jgi:hypothetical protein
MSRGILNTVNSELDTFFGDNPQLQALDKKPKMKVKNKKNLVASGIARAKGALTGVERSLQKAFNSSQGLVKKQADFMEQERNSRRLGAVLDQMGTLSPEEMLNDSTYQRVAQAFPGLTKENYINKTVPAAIQRKKLVQQLSRLPMGTNIPKESAMRLKELGIEDPQAYMSLSAKAQGGILGAFQSVAQARSEAALARGDASELTLGVGAPIIERTKAINTAIQESFQKETEALNAINNRALELFRAQVKRGEPLTKNQKLSQERNIKSQVDKSFKKAETVFQFWKQINDFSDPEKAFSTVRLSGDDQMLGGNKVSFKKLENKVGFQNARDIAMLYSFIKILDPESVVREGEVKLSDQAKGLLQSLGIEWNRIWNGQLLDERQRNGILSVANDGLVAVADNIGNNLSTVDSMVNEYGLNRESIIGKGQKRILDTAEKLKSALGEAREGDKGKTAKSRGREEAPKFDFEFDGIEVQILPD